jgi:hypothetical protein
VASGFKVKSKTNNMPDRTGFDKCPKNTYSTGAADTCSSCGLGHSDAGSASCKFCSTGQYFSEESKKCLNCEKGKYSEKGTFPQGVRGLLFRQLLPGLRLLLPCLREIAQSRNKTVSQVAINWCICKGTIPIPGAKSVEQARENIGALGWLLTASEVAQLDQAAASVDKKMVQNIFQTR